MLVMVIVASDQYCRGVSFRPNSVFWLPSKYPNPCCRSWHACRYAQSNRAELGHVATEAATGVSSFFSDQLWQPCEVTFVRFRALDGQFDFFRGFYQLSR